MTEKKPKKPKKLNAGEKKALESGFKIGERSPAIGTKAYSAKKVAEYHAKKMR